MILQSHTDYEDSIDLPSVSDIEFRLKSRKHREFIKQPLKLGMFIPCDENDVPLDEPIDFSDWSENSVVWEATKTESEVFNDWFGRCKKYQQAKERVLFEGFGILYQDSEDDCVQDKSKQAFIFNRQTKLCESDDGEDLKTIEDLVKYNLKLTDSTIKQLNL